MTKGHCLCGNVSWEYKGQKNWSCYCHCDDCRRNCAAPVAAFIGIFLKNFKWTGKQPKAFTSSKGVERYFCETCGSPMAFQADRYEGEILLYAASMKKPEMYNPQFHLHHSQKLDWLTLSDELPKYTNSIE